jgi:ribose-phosphate pyrophosphokinase
MSIDINKRQNIDVITFPDGQTHVRLKQNEGRHRFLTWDVNCSITTPEDLFLLQQTVNAIEKQFGKKGILTIPYLMGARFDRVMQPGDSFDLEVVANVINSLNFTEVRLLDVHSEIATALIKNNTNTTNQALVEKYKKPNSILICPDTGASKKIDNYFKWNNNLVDVVICTKKRDLSNGKITLKVLEPEKCLDKDCVIIDDLCDGGGTFLAIASQIQDKTLTLIVTHGIFSQGFTQLHTKFDEIITTDSYHNWTQADSPILNVISTNQLY